MTDIAALGLSVDSTQVTAATAALDKLTASAAPAADAMAVLQKTMDQAVGDANVMAVAVKNQTTLLDANSESLRGQRTVLRGIATDMALFGGTAGQTAALIGTLYYENAHIIEGFGGLKSAIGALLTPQNILIGGMVALAAGSFLAVTSVAAQEKAFDDLADKTDSTVASLHALDSAAAFKGISTDEFLKGMDALGVSSLQAKNNIGSLSELLRANGAAAGTLVQNVSTVADLIKNASSEAQKYQLIQQAGLPATRQWVDLMSQGSAGLHDVTAAAVGFGNAADQALIAKAKEFDDEWNKSWKNFSDGAKVAVVESVSYIDQLGAQIRGGLIGGMSLLGSDPTQLNRYLGSSLLAHHTGTTAFGPGITDPNKVYSGFPQTNAPTGTGNNGTTIDPAVLQKQLQLAQQAISAQGQLASVTDQVRSKELQVQQERLQGVSISQDMENRLKSYTEAQALGTLQINQQANAQNILSATVGMGVGQTEAYRVEQEKLFDFQQRGIVLTDAQSTSLHNSAIALGDATQRAATLKLTDDTLFNTMQIGKSQIDQMIATTLRQLYGDDYQAHMNDAIAGQIRLNDTLTQTKSVATNALSTFAQDLVAGKSAADSLHDALTNIENKLIDIASDKLISAAFGSSLSGLFGGIFKGTSGAGSGGALDASGNLLAATHHTGGMIGESGMPTRFVSADAFSLAPRYHTGGMIGSDEVPIIAKKGEGVFTPAQMAALAPAGGTNTSTAHVTINQTNTFNGADPGSEARLRAAMETTKQQAIAGAVQAVQSINATSPAYLRNKR